MTDVGEAIGIVRAARAVSIPVPISFTIETDGRLAGAASLAQAIDEVDSAGGPKYFLVSCSHPTYTTAQDELTDGPPGVGIFGDCCGTDTRHVAALWNLG